VGQKTRRKNLDMFSLLKVETSDTGIGQYIKDHLANL
jgi:hypothetical protein